MTFKSILSASLTAAILSIAPLSAQTSNPSVNEAVARLQAEGYTVIEVSTGLFGFEVEGIAPGGRSIELEFDSAGNLRQEEIIENGIRTETTYDPNGNVIETETRPVESEEEEEAREREEELLEAAEEAAEEEREREEEAREEEEEREEEEREEEEEHEEEEEEEEEENE